MRTMFILPLILFCSATAREATAQPAEPALAFQTGDLTLDSAASRAELRARVADAVRDFCRSHSRDVTPQLVRNKHAYCQEQVRSAVVAEMPRKVRRSYFRARREAGLYGTGL